MEKFFNDLILTCQLEEKFPPEFFQKFWNELDKNKDGMLNINEISGITELIKDKSFLMQILQGLIYKDNVPENIKELTANSESFTGIDISKSGLGPISSTASISEYMSRLSNYAEMLSFYGNILN